MASVHTDPLEFVNASNTTQIIKDLAVHTYGLTRKDAPDIWIGRAWDPSSSEHGTGRALDIIVSTNTGTLPSADQKRQAALVVDWFKRNADQLHLGWIIWDKQIWSVSRQDEGWRDLTDRNGIGDWHQDHIHIYLDDTYGTIPSEPLVKGTTMATTTTKYAAAMLNVWNASTGSAWEGEYQKGDAVQVTGITASERTQVLFNGALKWVTTKWLSDVNPNPPVVVPPVKADPTLDEIVKALTSKFDEVNKNINALRAEILARDTADTKVINQTYVTVQNIPEGLERIKEITAKVTAIQSKQSNIFK